MIFQNITLFGRVTIRYQLRQREYYEIAAEKAVFYVGLISRLTSTIVSL